MIYTKFIYDRRPFLGSDTIGFGCREAGSSVEWTDWRLEENKIRLGRRDLDPGMDLAAYRQCTGIMVVDLQTLYYTAVRVREKRRTI